MVEIQPRGKGSRAFRLCSIDLFDRFDNPLGQQQLLCLRRNRSFYNAIAQPQPVEIKPLHAVNEPRMVQLGQVQNQ